MIGTYIERACTFEHEGRVFESGGAFVSPEFAIGYVKGDRITNWHGDQVLGTIEHSASWRTPRSFMSDRMFQLRVRIGDTLYTGRSCGDGMIWKGRRCAR